MYHLHIILKKSLHWNLQSGIEVICGEIRFMFLQAAAGIINKGSCRNPFIIAYSKEGVLVFILKLFTIQGGIIQ